MFIKCCNSECQAPFDHRHGRLIRFSRTIAEGKYCMNQSFIRHFWLCGKCAELYVFDYESGMSVKIKPRHEESSKGRLSRAASAA